MKLKNFIVASLLVLLIYGCSGSAPGTLPLLPDEQPARESFGSLAEMVISEPYRDNCWSGNLEIDGHYWMADYTADGALRWAAGKGIPVDDPLAFIDAHPGIFKVGSGSLHEMCDEYHAGTRYAIYRQVVDGIELIDTRIDLRIKFGNIILLGVDVAGNLESLPPASISRRDASAIAASYHPGDPLHACRLFAKEYTFGYHPFWRVYIGDYYMEISAVDGNIIEDRSFLWEYEYDGEVSGYVSEVNPLEPFPMKGIFDLDVLFHEESALATTDLDGLYYSSSAGYSEQNTTAAPKGPWAEINRYDYTTAQIDMVTYDGITAEFTFDNDNSKHAERNVFYWTNVGHNYAKNIEPEFTALDRVVVSSVERNAWCNAMAGWGEMFYYKAKSPCLNLAHIPDVILHEYGHEYQFFHYWLVDEAESPDDIHEGFADYYAATVTDSPIIGTNWQGPGTHIRNCDNTLWWPDNNCGGECHCLGQILAGAMWDVRERLGREYTDHIWHFSKYGIPMTFPEVAMELCVADDDDGDLSNGTPNFTDIYISFEKIHGIPMPDAPLYDDLELSVVPDVENPAISRATGGSIGYTIHIENVLGEVANVDVWAAVLRPNGMWYGPMVPPSHYIGVPPNLNFAPYVQFQYHLVQNIPAGLPLGAVFDYHVRLGDYIDFVEDQIIADDYFSFEIVE